MAFLVYFLSIAIAVVFTLGFFELTGFEYDFATVLASCFSIITMKLLLTGFKDALRQLAEEEKNAK